MKCMSCKDDKLYEALATYFATLEDGYVIIENVPCMKCGQCGEEFFSASVMERIDGILAGIGCIDSRVFITDYRAAA